jgi:hypothetical protein
LNGDENGQSRQAQHQIPTHLYPGIKNHVFLDPEIERPITPRDA